MADYSKMFDDLMKKEGGFQQQSADTGNWCGGNLIGTNWGVAATGYKAAKGVCPTVSQMKNLTKEEAKQIWKKIVWNPMRGDEINSQGNAAMILDATGGGKSGYLHTRVAINKTAGNMVVNEHSGMSFTSKEIAELNKLNQAAFFQNFNEIRKKYFLNHYQYQKYGKGWLNRLKETYNKYIEEVGKYAPAIGLGGIFFLTIGFFLYTKYIKK